ncbi:NAD(P)-dependent alcohol dehydrogenase [Microbacterium sp. E-13]|uniref:NAD(P)-dependent alcohol dehydrogenase n=1 Tax=Microbacterium sp. E-13 TaxID=3404048 RepID=UPI003CED567D
MRAVVYDRYGGPEQLRVEDAPVPTPRTGEVLVQVVATGVNLSDWEALRGSPAYARLGGLTRPRRRTLGSDIAGRVAALGPGSTRFRVGDEVFGDVLMRKGGFAEYAIAGEGELALKPPSLSFIEAATIPQSGAIALQAVAHAEAGDRMLVNGSGGGTGMFALQLARSAGVVVTGVDNAAKLEFMRSMGADSVIDYRTEDFTRTGPYDLIIDLVASRSVYAYRRALAARGRYFIVGGTVRALLRIVTIGALIGAVSGRRLGVLAVRQGPPHFAPLVERCASGEVRISIDPVFPLDQTPAALARVGTGQALGKVVVAVQTAAG